jgi:hypothetical protein
LSRAATCSAILSSFTGALVLNIYEPTTNEIPAYKAVVDEVIESITEICDKSMPGSENMGIKIK